MGTLYHPPASRHERKATLSEPARQHRLYRLEAVVLAGMDFKEADRILTLFSREEGKLRVIAKGIRKPTSRLGYGLDHLARVRLQLAGGRELDVVTGVELLDAHPALAGDVRAYAYASHVAELVDRLTVDRQANPAVFDILTGALAAITSGADPYPVARYAELSLFTLLGFRPELYACVGCGAEIGPVVNALSPRLGGLLCPACQRGEHGEYPLSVEAQKYLRHLDRAGLAATLGLNPSERARRELEWAMLAWARQHAERDFTSLAVLRQVQSGEAT
jgi:DNA repair protein RecO (recombination protein O)